jgi:hypothetical protein
MTEKLNARMAAMALLAGFSAIALSAAAADEPVTRDQFLQLQQQNDLLRQQVLRQDQVINLLSNEVSEIRDSNAKTDRELSDIKADTAAASKSDTDSGTESAGGARLGNVAISGEGGVAFFESQRNGENPNADFRIDEARLFLDAPVWKQVYFYTEVDLAQREMPNLNLSVGELYLEVEDISDLWGRDRMLNLRAGRFYIPFGEEYEYRFAIDNPLISHSVSDLWGTDDGVELYGSAGSVQYVLAVQNGGGQPTQDFNADKAVIGRIGWDPLHWLHVSASAMRTGNLDSANDQTSALWFGNAWFRSLGSPMTSTFRANLAEGDVDVKFRGLNVRTAGGYIGYADNDPTADNARDVYYYYLEGTQNITKQLYFATRFSQVLARNGFPIVGNGNMYDYFMEELTDDYWRLSLGLGYRFSGNFLVKGEYSFNRGQEAEGDSRLHEDQFALEAAFKF